MKRIEPESAGDVLRQLLEEENMISRIEECKAIDLWPRIVGLQLSRQTTRPTVKAGIMTIGVPAAALRQEFNMNRSQLIEIINNALGKEVIKDIRFIGG